MGFDLREILPPTIEELISVLEFSTESLSDDALDSVEDCRAYLMALGCLDSDINDYETIDTYCALKRISDFYDTQSYHDILSELFDVWESRCGW